MKIAIFSLLLGSCLCSLIPPGRQPAIASTKSARVVGGDEAEPHSAPYIVSFRELDEHICAGAIVNKRWIVSAAHCFLFVGRVTAVAGIHSIDDEGQRRQVENYITHKNYSGSLGPFDIAAVKVLDDFVFNEFVQPISLPTPKIIPSGDVTVFGWGSTSTGNALEMPEVLHKFSPPIISYDECLESLADLEKDKLRETNICTGPLTGGFGSCVRDSGGPLVQKNSRGTVELLGIVSWGYYPCGTEGRPSVYTRVSAYNEWIEEFVFMWRGA